jgi:putative tryptophan/tyrosine transport system substrate-binding protein
VFAAKAATVTIPIVFSVNEDPVKLGLVASMARPEGNATGINFLAGELTAKRLELLRGLVPAAVRVAVLVNPANTTNSESTLRDVQSTAQSLGLQIQIFNASREAPVCGNRHPHGATDVPLRSDEPQADQHQYAG